MITLITGIPGMGKSAFVLSELITIKTRPLFIMGIPHLAIDHVRPPPIEEWTELRKDQDDENLLLPYFTFPPHSIVVIDEAQRVYRPRTAGSKVPDIVAAFETHRHLGIDFYLLTQSINLLDSNIRRLVGRHIDIRDTFLGRYRYEWKGLGEPESKASRDLANKTRYSLPKHVFKLYKSAEVHTTPIKPPISRKLKLIILVVIGLIIGGYLMYHRVLQRTGFEKNDALTVVNSSASVVADGKTYLPLSGYFLDGGNYYIIKEDSSVQRADGYEFRNDKYYFSVGDLWFVY